MTDSDPHRHRQGAGSSGSVLVFGSLNMDLVVRAPVLPRPGETVLGGDLERMPGGKGANQAVAASRLGAAVRMVGAVGDDEHGRTLRGVLDDEGVDTRGVATDLHRPTGVALITVHDGEGENTIVVSSGANRAVRAEQFDAALREGPFDGVLLMQLEVPVDVVRHAATLGQSRGAVVVLNAAPASPLPSELLEAIDVLVVNELEAVAAIGGKARAAAESAEVLSGSLASGGRRTAIVTLGAAGAVAHDARGPYRAPAPTVEPVDTVGAGDAFVGAIAALLVEGSDLRDGLPRACAAAAVAVTRTGAMPALPNRTDVDRMIERR